jgi:hypothetical protein
MLILFKGKCNQYNFQFQPNKRAISDFVLFRFFFNLFPTLSFSLPAPMECLPSEMFLSFLFHMGFLFYIPLGCLFLSSPSLSKRRGWGMSFPKHKLPLMRE